MSKEMATELQKLIGNNQRRNRHLKDTQKKIKTKGRKAPMPIKSKGAFPVKK